MYMLVFITVLFLKLQIPLKIYRKSQAVTNKNNSDQNNLFLLDNKKYVRK